MSLPHVARQQSGVTLVELSVTLVVIAVLTVMAVSATGLLGQAMLSGRVKGASEELATAIRSARQLAISQARDHCISMSAGQYRSLPWGSLRHGLHRHGDPGSGGPLGQSQCHHRGAPVHPGQHRGSGGTTTITVTTADANTGGTCSVVLTVTPEGGVQQPGATC